jgi:DNA-directed RNA polymerase specialized sigma24 family protein
MKSEEEEDKQIFTALLSPGNRRDAFVLLLNKYQKRLYTFMRRMNLGHEETDEQLQNLFLWFWKNLDHYQRDNVLSVLLYRLAAEICTGFLTRHPQQKLPGLTIDQQLIFRLKQSEDLDFDEIAQITQVSNKEARQHFYQAINILHKQTFKT